MIRKERLCEQVLEVYRWETAHRGRVGSGPLVENSASYGDVGGAEAQADQVVKRSGGCMRRHRTVLAGE